MFQGIPINEAQKSKERNWSVLIDGIIDEQKQMEREKETQFTWILSYKIEFKGAQMNGNENGMSEKLKGNQENKRFE